MPRVPSHWIRSRADEAAVQEGCTFDLKAAERVRLFFHKFLRHSKGAFAGKPFELLPWQWDDVVAPLFGWKRPDGTRRFRKAYCELPKKNGKSTLASGIGLYLLCGENEPGAEVYSLATDRDQANIVHGEAVQMVKASAPLSAYLKINASTHNIAFPKRNGWYRSLSAEAETKEGLNANGLIVDELHVWKGRKLWEAIKYAGASRRQPLLFVITTAGDDMLSVCREQHEYAQAIMRGTVVDTRFFAYIRAARAIAEGDKEDNDWSDPQVWHAANPSLGVTINLDDFAADCEEAKKSPSTLAAFKRYRLCVWATSTNPWLRVEDWQACGDPFTEADLCGRACYGGLDPASTRDLAAFVLCFPDGADRYRLLPYFWLPEATVHHVDSPEHYRVWARTGMLRTTPGNVCDYAFIKRGIVALSQKFRLLEYAFDPWNAEKTTQELEEHHGVKRIEFRQTIQNFAEPTREFERLVVGGLLRHPNHPVLSWMAQHVHVKSDVNNNKRPVKPADNDHRKIDGITAAVMALARAMLSKTGPSIYETQGITFLGAEANESTVATSPRGPSTTTTIGGDNGGSDRQEQNLQPSRQ